MNYQITVSREDGHWLGQCVELPEALDYAPTLSGLVAGMRDAIILAADLADDTPVEVSLIAAPELEEPLAVALEIAQSRKELKALAVVLQENTKQAAVRLAEQGVSVRDSAQLLGVSPGRVSQLAAR